MSTTVFENNVTFSRKMRQRMRQYTVTTGWVSLVMLACASAGFAYEVLEIRNGGTIAGNVALVGTPPPPRHFAVNKGPEVCGTDRVLTKVDVHHGMVSGVIIALEGVQKGKPFSSYHEKAEEHGHGEFHYAGGETLNLSVQLKTCSFGPFTGVIMADDATHFVNHDPIKHTLHTYMLQSRNTTMLKTVHAQSLGAGGQTEKIFPKHRLRHARAVVLTCDRHDFMENWLYLAENPYYAISDEAGNFSIDQVPPGDYLIVAWHPVLGMQEQRVTIVPQTRHTANFKFAQ